MRILATIALTLIISLVFPFWGWIMIVPFFMAFFFLQKGWKAWWMGFWAILLLWAVMALTQYLTGSRLISDKMAVVFKMPNGIVLIVVQALIGALLAGFAALTGQSMRRLISNSKK